MQPATSLLVVLAAEKARDIDRRAVIAIILAGLIVCLRPA
jgi:hypothetical protein